MAILFPADPLVQSTVVPVHASGFYAQLRAEPALVGRGGELNLEGATLVRNGRYLRFYNRGNGRAGSVVGSVDVRLEAFLAYLAAASRTPEAPFAVTLSGRMTYDLGRATDGAPFGVTDAITLSPLPGAPRGLAGEIHLLSVIVEHTATAVHDGFTSDSSVALALPDGRLLLAPLGGIDGAGTLKVEGLSIVSARWAGRPAQLHINLLAVTDADAKDPNTPSTLARIEVTYQP
jgi:hypothetical protein